MQNGIVVIAGIKRSASTAMYNIVRLALQQEGYTVNVKGHDYTPRSVPNSEVDLVKRHPFDKSIAEQADHIFVTDRCDNDILESLDRMWDSGNAERLSGMRGQLALWMLYTSPEYYFYYRGSIEGWMERVVSILSLDVDLNALEEEFEAIKPPAHKQDTKTLLFPNHISK